MSFDGVLFPLPSVRSGTLWLHPAHFVCHPVQIAGAVSIPFIPVERLSLSSSLNGKEGELGFSGCSGEEQLQSVYASYLLCGLLLCVRDSSGSRGPSLPLCQEQRWGILPPSESFCAVLASLSTDTG